MTCDRFPSVDGQSHWRGLEPCQETPVNSAVMGRLTAGINKVCVKNRHVANYLEMEGQRDGSLFETAWMLILCESENGICLPQRTQAALRFLSLCLWIRVYVDMGPQTLPHPVVMASFLSGHLVSPINAKALGLIFYAVSCVWRSAAAWHALRQNITHLEQMTNADSPRVNQSLNWVWIEPAESISSYSQLMAMGNVHEIC